MCILGQVTQKQKHLETFDAAKIYKATFEIVPYRLGNFSRNTIFADICDDNICTCAVNSKYINPTSGCEYLTENKFSDIDFLYNVKILAIRRCFSHILAIFHCAYAVSTY